MEVMECMPNQIIVWINAFIMLGVFAYALCKQYKILQPDKEESKQEQKQK